MKPVLFYLLSAVILLFAVFSVTTRRVFRAAVYLLFVLIATAGIYFLVQYNFLAAFQLTIYAGGIIVLIIFAIMLTSQMNEKLQKPNMTMVLIAALTGVLGISLVCFVLSEQVFVPVITENTYQVKEIANMLISYGKNGYALPFEVISLLLLAAIIASIIMAKKEKIKS